MSIPLIINGATFNYPVNFDEAWGIDATGWAQAVTNGMLQRAGGSFPLLADVNFGASFGLLSAYFTSRAASPSTVGTFRMASADSGVGFRNNANNANLILTTDSSDNLLYNGHIISPASAGTVTSITGTPNQIIASSPTGAVVLSTPQSIATTSSPTFLAETLSHAGLILQDTEGTPKTVTLSAPSTLSSTWALALPVNAGLANQVLQTDGAGNTSWVNAAGGGTVNSGTTGQLAWYTGATAISSTSFLSFSSPNLTFNAGSGVSMIDIVSGGVNGAVLQLEGNSLTNNITTRSDGSFGISDSDNSRSIFNYTRPGGGGVAFAVPLAMGSNKITNMANGSVSSDAATVGQIPVFKAPTVQRLTLSSGTYTTPTGPSPLYIRVKMVGAGGGGSGSGTAGGGTGGNGGNTTFGTSLLTAGGGVGGTFGASTGGSGGSNTTGGIGILNIQGGAGQGFSNSPSGTAATYSGAIGGSTPWSGGARTTSGGSATAGQAGQSSTGEGGQGGPSTGTGNNFTGNGGGGGGYLECILTSLSSTYAYTTGTGGTGGSGGSSGLAGGAGGSGFIVVEEYYQ